jgi:CMP-N-acetylneuraminic acid synthetase
MNLIIADDIKKFPADIFLMTHTTNPLLSKKTILGALNKFKVLFKDGKIDSLFTVNKIQTRFYNEDGIPINHDPNNLIQTQNLEPWYEENSNLYIFTADSFSKTVARIGLKPNMLVTPRRETIDIDTPEDWDMGISITRYLLNAGLIER